MSEFDLELSSPLTTAYSGPLGGPGEGGHIGNDWFIRFGMDLGAPVGTEVRASFDGHITVFHPHDPAADSGKVYGAQIFMRSHNDLMGAFLTHMSDVPSHLAVGSTVSRGELLGTVMQFGGRSPHVHMAVVEVIGGPAANNRVGVDLYQLFQDMSGTDASTLVRFFQDPTTPPAPAGGGGGGGAPTIRLDTIRGIQQALVTLGFDPGPVDGIDGPKTQAALAEFQNANGLPADGFAGPDTITALTSALEAVGVAVG